MKDKTTTIIREEFDIQFPKSISIGDPMYFEEYGEDSDYVYSKRFRGKGDWIGKLVLTKELIETDAFNIDEVVAKIYFAPTEAYLETFMKNMMYQSQKEKVTMIGVDTAEYLVIIEGREIVISTGSDGQMGHVIEMMRKSNPRLEGITIELTGTDINTFESFKSDMKYLFNA